MYYGAKLGHSVPWVSGWPFDSVSHPQYVGSVLTVWGGLALLAGSAPGGALVALGAYWSVLYIITGVQEERL